MNINMKDTIDRELECIVLSEEMKSRIRKKAVSRRRDGVLTVSYTHLTQPTMPTG